MIVGLWRQLSTYADLLLGMLRIGDSKRALTSMHLAQLEVARFGFDERVRLRHGEIFHVSLESPISRCSIHMHSLAYPSVSRLCMHRRDHTVISPSTCTRYNHKTQTLSLPNPISPKTPSNFASFLILTKGYRGPTRGVSILYHRRSGRAINKKIDVSWIPIG